MDDAVAPGPSRLWPLRLGGFTPAWALAVCVLLPAAVLWSTRLWGATAPQVGGTHIPWWTIGLLFFITEAYSVRVHVRREAHAVSFTEIALVTGLYLVRPELLLAAQLLGGGAALGFHRRQRSAKLAFSVGQLALTSAVAVLVFDRIRSTHELFGPAGWAAASAAALAAVLTKIVVGTIGTGIAQGKWPLRQLPMTTAVSVLATVTTACVALTILELTRNDARASVLLFVPLAIAALAFRAYMQHYQQHERIQFLYDSMRQTQGAAEFGLAIGQLVVAARQLTRADYGEIVLFPTASEPGRRTVLPADGELHSDTNIVRSDDDQVLTLMPADRDVLVLRGDREPSALDGYLADRQLDDAMIATLAGEGKPFGLLVVGNRSSDVDEFGRESSKLLGTFARHAGVLLDNGRLERSLADVTNLKDRLRHQAFHDSLTQLPNRAAFAERTAAAINETDGEKAAAVLFIDLDDFKSINDSRGHSEGDNLLVQVGRRVAACVRPGDFPARLGGDEFGVLLESTTSEGASTAATRLLEAFSEPFELADTEAHVHASVGIAIAGHGSTVDGLLGNADIAMYAAKAAGKNRFALYESRLHDAIREQHDLTVELEAGLDQGQIIAVFQPIVSLESGRVVAFEALARWNRPGHGMVPPIQFIEAAERANLIAAVGETIMRQACYAAGDWYRANGDPTTSVTVNLSPRQLMSDRLADDVARILVETRLDAHRLTLEITETTMSANVEVAIARLEELHGLGVRLSLDDFGTGHSSLERLELLPLDSIKIAKPFVDRLLDSKARRRSLVGTFVGLADTLGLDCIAEGVEEDDQVGGLLQLGCKLGQGYHFAKPMLAADVAGYLRTRRPPPELRTTPVLRSRTAFG